MSISWQAIAAPGPPILSADASSICRIRRALSSRCCAAESAPAAMDGVAGMGRSGYGRLTEDLCTGGTWNEAAGIWSSGRTSILVNGMPLVTVLMAVFLAEISSRRRRTSRS